MRKPLSIACLGLGLMLAACGGSSTAPAAAAPITIGVSVSLTGDFSGDGKALVQGYDRTLMPRGACSGTRSP